MDNPSGRQGGDDGEPAGCHDSVNATLPGEAAGVGLIHSLQRLAVFLAQFHYAIA
jgi:hypothetical protein